MAGLPHRISTLLYCFNAADEVLLLQRIKEPNRGLWSPPGGKLESTLGESPHACAAREANEELGLSMRPEDFSLTGIVSEQGYQGQAHWLMFLFELRSRLEAIPPVHREGSFAFFHREALADLAIPATDREQIWPLFWRHRGGLFVAHCQCDPAGPHTWTVAESRPANRA
ncbi:MAG: NUDIX domain-containing protein [Verrucomicrobia bacterium]|nr:NUDIX domain-containing protein [Verrucomicrobiota bacterium]